MSAQIAGCLDLERRTVTMSDFYKYRPKITGGKSQNLNSTIPYLVEF